jgi:hypothetical protein
VTERHNIGAVGFATIDSDGKRRRYDICGPERVALLRCAYERRLLPNELVLVANHGSGPWNVPIMWDDVNWSGLLYKKSVPRHHCSNYRSTYTFCGAFCTLCGDTLK